MRHSMPGSTLAHTPSGASLPPFTRKRKDRCETDHAAEAPADQDASNHAAWRHAYGRRPCGRRRPCRNVAATASGSLQRKQSIKNGAAPRSGAIDYQTTHEGFCSMRDPQASLRRRRSKKPRIPKPTPNRPAAPGSGTANWPINEPLPSIGKWQIFVGSVETELQVLAGWNWNDELSDRSANPPRPSATL